MPESTPAWAKASKWRIGGDHGMAGLFLAGGGKHRHFAQRAGAVPDMLRMVVAMVGGTDVRE